MAPRTGRPKTENPRSKQVCISLTEEEMEILKENREKDKEPERTFVTWLGRKVSEMAKRMAKK